jgi:hypothetical protein
MFASSQGGVGPPIDTIPNTFTGSVRKTVPGKVRKRPQRAVRSFVVRNHVLRVRLSDIELAELDSAAVTAGLSRPRWVRHLITTGKRGHAPASREDALAMLETSARAGSVAAQIALAREMRIAPLTPRANGRPTAIRVEDLSADDLRER